MRAVCQVGPMALLQARLRGASTAATTAPRRRCGSTTRRRANVPLPPRGRPTMGPSTTRPSQGAARGTRVAAAPTCGSTPPWAPGAHRRCCCAPWPPLCRQVCRCVRCPSPLLKAVRKGVNRLQHTTSPAHHPTLRPHAACHTCAHRSLHVGAFWFFPVGLPALSGAHPPRSLRVRFSRTLPRPPTANERTSAYHRLCVGAGRTWSVLQATARGPKPSPAPLAARSRACSLLRSRSYCAGRGGRWQSRERTEPATTCSY